MPSVIESIAGAEAAERALAAHKKAKQPAATEEDKRAKFVRVVEPRVQRAIHAIEIVAAIGGPNRYRYDFGPSDADEILTALTEAVAKAGERLRGKPKQLKLFALSKQQPNGNGGE